MTNLNHALEIIFSGFVVRTREEMKPFETLVNKRISFDRIEQENFKEIFEQQDWTCSQCGHNLTPQLNEEVNSETLLHRRIAETRTAAL